MVFATPIIVIIFIQLFQLMLLPESFKALYLGLKVIGNFFEVNFSKPAIFKFN